MDKIAIRGWGIISEIGNSEEEIIRNWDIKKLPEGKPLEFSHNLDLRKIRRMGRLGKMVTSVSEKCLTMDNSVSPEQTGIIMNTDYGSINLNIDFGKVLNTPELASPMDFANTVSNAAVGNVALYFGLKGRSTLLMGSNAISCSIRQIEKYPEEVIIVCGGDEYCEPIVNYANQKLGNKAICEGVAAVLLGKKESQWGSILGDAQAGIGFSPLYQEVKDVKENYINVMNKVLASSTLKKEDIDIIFMSSDSFSGIRKYENEAVNAVFGKGMDREYIKDMLGESLGASVISSVIISSVLIKNNRYQNILVLGTEVSGTLEAYIVGK